MKNKIALAGVPNCGKTTFWNLVTGRRGKVGNWPGVTAEKLSAPLRLFPDTELVDLPGAYSLSSKSLEEAAAENFLKSGEADSLVIIIDGTKPEQGLYFALELLSLGIPSALGINFADELFRRKTSVDTEKLSNELMVPVFLISAKENKNISELLFAAKNCIGASIKAPARLSQEERRKKAAELSEKCFQGKSEKKPSAFPAFICAIFLLTVLILVFGFPFSVLKESISAFFEHFSALSAALLNYLKAPPLFASLISEGIIPGLSSAVSFIPELAALFFALAFLEDSGYMARAAFSVDFLLKKIGLSGRSVIPLLLGFGCTVPAVYAAKSSDTENARNKTLSMLMFVPCGARLPLSVLICETVFPSAGKAAVFLFYFFTIFIGAAFSFFQNRGKKNSFILELPPVRVPFAKSILKITCRRLMAFITKAAGIVVLTSVLVWVLKNFSPFFEPVELQSESTFFAIGKFLAPVFAPAGIPYEGALALFCGLFAKESALFALVSLSDNIGALFSPVSAVSFLLFFLIYSPCTSCLSAIKHQFGAKKAVWLFLRQTAFAYFISFAFYQFAVLIQNIFIP